MVHSVEFIYVHRKSASSTGIAECFFAQTSDLLHDIRRVVMVDHIDLIVAFVGIPEFLGRGKLGFQNIHAYRCYYRFHRSWL